MKKGRDQSVLTTQLSRVLYTQHKMRHFLNSTLKQGRCCGGPQDKSSLVAAHELAQAQVKREDPQKHKIPVRASSGQFSPERDILVHDTSIQAIPPACPRLWFTCVLCQQPVHSARLHFIHNAGGGRPWITTCPKCHVAIEAAQG